MAQPPDNDIGTAADALHDLGRLSGWVAHEINNPLGGIQNAFALIQDAIPADHPHFKYIAAIEREISRIAALTGRLYHTYSYDGQRAVDSVAHAVADAVHALEPLRHARRVAVETVIEPPAAPVGISGDLGRAAIRHLLQHALEGAAPGSTVILNASRDGHLIWFAVPNGPAPERAARGLVAGPPGLALVLVQRLVKTLAGLFVTTAASDGPGTIRIGVPIVAAFPEDA